MLMRPRGFEAYVLHVEDSNVEAQNEDERREDDDEEQRGDTEALLRRPRRFGAGRWASGRHPEEPLADHLHMPGPVLRTFFGPFLGLCVFLR